MQAFANPIRISGKIKQDVADSIRNAGFFDSHVRDIDATGEHDLTTKYLMVVTFTHTEEENRMVDQLREVGYSDSEIAILFWMTRNNIQHVFGRI